MVCAKACTVRKRAPVRARPLDGGADVVQLQIEEHVEPTRDERAREVEAARRIGELHAHFVEQDAIAERGDEGVGRLDIRDVERHDQPVAWVHARGRLTRALP